MKKIISALLFLVVLSINAFAQQKELVDKVVAKVGDEYILLSEVEEPVN